MTLTAPTNPIFAHSENKIFASDVDKFLDCTFEITTNGTVKTFNNRIYAYNGNCEINLDEIPKYILFDTIPKLCASVPHEHIELESLMNVLFETRKFQPLTYTDE